MSTLSTLAKNPTIQTNGCGDLPRKMAISNAAAELAEVTANIAHALDRESLETRGLDSLDFVELSVYQIKEIIAAAFKAGLNTAR